MSKRKFHNPADGDDANEAGPTLEEVQQVIKELHEMGLIRDSGLRRPGPDGTMRIVWVAVEAPEA